jgi:hypothetical protein
MELKVQLNFVQRIQAVMSTSQGLAATPHGVACEQMGRFVQVEALGKNLAHTSVASPVATCFLFFSSRRVCVRGDANRKAPLALEWGST